MILRRGAQMVIKLFFQYGDVTKFIEISPETHKRLRLYSNKTNTALKRIIKSVYEKYGDVSEELIVRYLNELGQ